MADLGVPTLREALSVLRFSTGAGLDSHSPTNSDGGRLAVLHPMFIEIAIGAIEHCLADHADAKVGECTETQVPHITSRSSTSLTGKLSAGGENTGSGEPGSEEGRSAGTTSASAELSGLPDCNCDTVQVHHYCGVHGWR